MDKTELRVNRIDSDDKSLKGLQNNGLVNFECADCGKLLLVLQLVATVVKEFNKSEVLTRVAVKCGLCGGRSYVQQIPGQFFPGAPNDQMVFDISDDDINTPEVDVLFKAWSK
jgi:hypothetical protein